MAATTAPALPQVSIARLPSTSGELFGREAELAWLDDCWQRGVHVATVVAWGGVGKSALVNRWLATMRDKAWDGAARVYGWSFDVQGNDRLTSSDEFLARALEELGDPDPTRGSPWDKGERLARLVRKERTILVLDGLEPLQWGPGEELGKLKDPALQALLKDLGALNNGLCLVTTRIEVADLSGLGGDKVEQHSLDHLSAEAGAELLEARGARGSPEDLWDAAREYDGHGLALTLLGTWVHKAHKGDIRQRDLIPPLEGKPARRMMATYELWFADKPELSVLRLLGLFDRPATEAEIAALRAEPPVAGLTDRLSGMSDSAWNEAVTALRDVRLLSAGAEGDERLDAHPLVREHFGAELRREQPDAWREGHRRLYEHLRATAKELPDTVEEMAPLYAAVVHGCLAGKNLEALVEVHWTRIERGARYFGLMELGAFGSEVAVLSAFFAPPWERLAPGLGEAWEAWVRGQAGSALRSLGRLPEAVGLTRQSLDAYVAQQNWECADVAASNLSKLLASRGELREALTHARKSVDFADQSGSAPARLNCRTTLAAVLHAMGRREEAAAQFEEAEAVQRDGDPACPRLHSISGFMYCDLLLDLGRDADVRDRAEKLFARREPVDSVLEIALDHLSLGRAHLLAVQRGADGDLALATLHLAQAVDGLRRSGYQDQLPRGLLARAALRTHTRAVAAARHDLDEALTLATRSGVRIHEADAHLAYARLALAEADPAAARAHLATARAIITATGYHRRDEELATLEAEAAEMAKTAPAQRPAPPPPAPPPTPVPVPEKASPMPAPLQLFYSYSHKDEALREDLETHLKILKRQGLIEPWHDRAITAGSEWAGAIDEHLEKADVILLLVSAAFIASDYCFDKELERAMARHDAKEALVIPIFLKPCEWSGTPFGKLQGLPRDAKAVTLWSNQDQAWTEIARGIRAAVEDVQKRRAGGSGGVVAHQAAPVAATTGGAAAAGGRVDGPFVSRLARVLAELYPRQEGSRRIAAGADLDVVGIHFDGTPVDNWFSIVDFARKQGKLGAVVALAREEFPASEELRRAAEVLGNPR